MRRAGLNAIRHSEGAPDKVTAANFEEAMEDSRATVTAKMEAEYKKMKGELKKRAMEVKPIGFLTDEMLTSTRDQKH